MTAAMDREAVARRLQRFVEGENPRSIYKLPPNGRLDPLRDDVSAILALTDARLRELEGAMKTLAGEPRDGGENVWDPAVGRWRPFREVARAALSSEAEAPRVGTISPESLPATDGPESSVPTALSDGGGA